jgi:hypothetical protein
MSELPDTVDFRALLRSLEVNEKPSEYSVPFVTATNSYGNGQTDQLQTLFIHCVETPAGRLRALQGKLEATLRQADHPHDSAIIAALIGVYATTRHLFVDELEYFNGFLNCIIAADVSHFVISLFRPYTFPKWNYFGYSFSSIEDSPLEYRSGKATSDFYTRYQSSLARRACLASPFTKKPIVGFLDLLNDQQHKTRVEMSQAGHSMVLNYYEHISKRYLEQMWDDLSERQLIPEAFAKAAMDINSFRDAVGTQTVSVFLNQSRSRWPGYVVPLGKTLAFNIINGESEIVLKAKEIHGAMGNDQPEIVRQFCRFGVKGHQALRTQKHPEAFLQFMIGIELLLSSPNNTTKAIAKRSSVLTTVPNADGFTKRQKEIEVLYGIRSQYVHAGKHPSEKATDELIQIYFQILSTVLSAPPRGENPENAHQEWLKNLDFVASGYNAGHLPSDELREKLALPSFPHVI